MARVREHPGWTIQRERPYFVARHPGAPALVMSCSEGDMGSAIEEWDAWMRKHGRDPDGSHGKAGPVPRPDPPPAQ